MSPSFRDRRHGSTVAPRDHDRSSPPNPVAAWKTRKRAGASNLTVERVFGIDSEPGPGLRVPGALAERLSQPLSLQVSYFDPFHLEDHVLRKVLRVVADPLYGLEHKHSLDDERDVGRRAGCDGILNVTQRRLVDAVQLLVGLDHRDRGIFVSVRDRLENLCQSIVRKEGSPAADCRVGRCVRITPMFVRIC